LSPDGVALILIGLAAAAAGAVATVAGFGIGSLLTPLLALQGGTKLAVALVSIPHVAGTALRLWMLRRHVTRPLLISFGLPSAIGGLTGALLHEVAGGPLLTAVFAGLLVFAGLSGLTGLAQRMRFGRRMAWVAGALSGLLGGMVGNQGGIRSAAMLGFDVPKEAFVATATAVALIVDGARVPVYLATQGSEMLRLWPFMLASVVGVLAGTLAGGRMLRRVPEPIFRRVVSVVLLVLGVAMLVSILR
jgi:uncharacterized membrane protein YfcA